MAGKRDHSVIGGTADMGYVDAWFPDKLGEYRFLSARS